MRARALPAQRACRRAKQREQSCRPYAATHAQTHGGPAPTAAICWSLRGCLIFLPLTSFFLPPRRRRSRHPQSACRAAISTDTRPAQPPPTAARARRGGGLVISTETSPTCSASSAAAMAPPAPRPPTAHVIAPRCAPRRPAPAPSVSRVALSRQSRMGNRIFVPKFVHDTLEHSRKKISLEDAYSGARRGGRTGRLDAGRARLQCLTGVGLSAPISRRAPAPLRLARQAADRRKGLAQVRRGAQTRAPGGLAAGGAGGACLWHD